MKLIEDLKSTTLTNVLIIVALLILISLWVYAEYKGSVLGIPFQAIRIALWLLITTPAFYLLAKDNFGGFTIQNISIMVGIGLAGIFFIIIKSKRFL